MTKLSKLSKRLICQPAPVNCCAAVARVAVAVGMAGIVAGLSALCLEFGKPRYWNPISDFSM